MVGDTDNDGYDDILIGAPEEDSAASGAGAAYLMLGPVSGVQSLSAADAILFGENGDDYFNISISSAGDLNADNYADIVIGARLDDWTDSNAGAAYMVLGPISGVVNAAALDGKVLGRFSNDWMGSAVGLAGDINNDGYSDVVVGAPQNDTTDTDSGMVTLIVGGGF